MPLMSCGGWGLVGPQHPAWALGRWGRQCGQERVSRVGREAAPGGPGSATALLLASPRLCQATMARLSAAGDGHAGWWGAVEGSSLISGWV